MTFATEIYDAFQTKQDNNDECKHLAATVKLIKHQLDDLEEITRGKEQSLQQELQHLDNCFKNCKGFIDKRRQQWELTDLVFNKSERDELKKLNEHLQRSYQQLEGAKATLFERLRRDDNAKVINGQNRMGVQLGQILDSVEALHDKVKSSPSQKVILVSKVEDLNHSLLFS